MMPAVIAEAVVASGQPEQRLRFELRRAAELVDPAPALARIRAALQKTTPQPGADGPGVFGPIHHPREESGP